MTPRIHTVQLTILPSTPYKTFLEAIVHDFAGVSDNIAYHLSYLEFLYKMRQQLPLLGYDVLNGLRIKTIIGEIASCAEVLLYDAVTALEVTDKHGNKCFLPLDKKVGFAVLLKYAVECKVVPKSLSGRLHQLFQLRHKIHLTHGKRDPYEFNESLMRDSEKTFEDLVSHFLTNRQRAFSARETVSPSKAIMPWKRIKKP